MSKIKCIKCLKEYETKEQKYTCSCGNEINVLEGKELVGLDESILNRLQDSIKDKDLNDFDILVHLGLIYKNDKDYNTTFNYINLAAENDCLKGIIELAQLYYDGHGVEKDYNKCAELVKNAVDRGDLGAYVSLGYYYSYGYGVEQDYKKAIELVKFAANHGDINALTRLAYFYEEGRVVSRDYIEAARIYEIAATKGGVIAQNRLAHLYYDGLGVEQNYKEAFKWNLLAAENGHAITQYTVAKAYHSGRGVELDYEKSFYWLLKSAEQGYCNSFYLLGAYYHHGFGVEKDFDEAIKWYDLAAKSGDVTAAKELSKLKAKTVSPVVNPVKLLSGRHHSEGLPDIELNDIIQRDSFLNVLEGSKDVLMVPRNFSSWGYGTYSYNANVLIIEDGVDDMKRVIFRDIDTFVYLGSKGITSMKAYTSMTVKRAIFINSGFLKGRNLLIEGCTYIIENFNDFNDKENFLKELKKKSDKMQNLLRDLLSLNNKKINEFIKENNIVIKEVKEVIEEVVVVEELFSTIDFNADRKDILEKLSNEPFLKNINIDKDKTIITKSDRIYSPSPYSSRYSKVAQTLIIKSNVDFIGSLAFKDIENLIYLGSRGMPNFNQWKKYYSDIPNVIFIDASFLAGKMYLVEGCTYIINNFEYFHDKENFIKTLKKKTDKIKELINDLIETNDLNIVKFLIEQNIATYEVLLNAANMDIEQETKILISNMMENLDEESKKEFESKKERKENLDLGFEKYTLKDFKQHFACTVKGDRIIISKYKGDSDIVTIPVVDDITKFEFKFIGKNNTIKKIYFEEGVTSIHRNYDSPETPFKECPTIQEMHLPKSLTHIDTDFISTLRRNRINIYSSNIDNPENVMMIDDLLIQYNSIIYLNNRSTVTKVEIPDSITNIPENLFSYCSSLAKINLHDKIISIGDEAFEKCTSLTAIELPNSIESIGTSIFSGCTALTSVNIPEKITVLKDNMFNGCKSLQTLELKDTITKLGSSVFDGCSSLVNIVLPNTIKQIGSSIFKNCTALSTLDLPSSITEIPNETFYGCSSLERFTINNNVTYLGQFSFYGCKKLSALTIPNSVKKIDNYALRATNISHIEIPNSVNDLLEGALAQCPSLKSVILPDTINTLDTSLFYECTNLENINIPDSVRTIASSVFYKCSSLKNLSLPKKLKSIANSAFFGCENLSNIILPDTLEEIGRGAFENCKSITEFAIPDGVERFKYNTFNGCISLEVIKMPKGLTYIEGCTFAGCSKLTEIEINDDITYIGGETFKGCTSLASVHIPSSLKRIENGLFTECTSIKKIDLPDGIEHISFSAFKGCTSLREITIPKTVTELREYAFRNCNDIKVYIDSNIKSIDYSAFRDSTNLTVVFSNKIPEKFEWLKEQEIKVECK